MTVIQETEGLPSSPEEGPSHSLPELVQPQPQASGSLYQGGVGSSHTKITFLQADSSGNDNTRPKHNSPPPTYKDQGWSDFQGEFQTDGLSNWGDADAYGLLEDENNEKMWFHPRNRAVMKVLGPGMLPVLANQRVHEESHDLVKISISIPDFGPPPSSSSESTFKPPDAGELRRAVPHQNAFYCPKCNGWMLIQKTRTTNLPTFKEYDDDCPDLFFPWARSKDKNIDCNAQRPEHLTYNHEPDIAHHYHLYEDSIPSTNLQPPYRRASWEPSPPLPKKACTHHKNPEENFWERPASSMMERDPEVDQAGIQIGVDYLDLYACCQCMTNIYITKRPIPGVVSPRLLADLQRERLAGELGVIRALTAYEFLLRAMESVLWKGEIRPLNFDGKSYRRSFGEDVQALQIWEQIGFTVDQEQKKLFPPSMEYPEAREKLLRAWVEIAALTADFLRPNRISSIVSQEGSQRHKLWVKVNSAQDEISDLMGAHPNQIPRGIVEAPQSTYDPVFQVLGLTQSSYSPKLLVYAYKMQTKCDITHLPIHFEALTKLVDFILPRLKQEESLSSGELRQLVVMERSKNHWTPSEYRDALKLLGFGEDLPLMVEIHEADTSFLENAFKRLLFETWKPPTDPPSSWSDDIQMRLEPSQQRQHLKDALRIIAEGTGRDDFYQIWKRANEAWSTMDPEKAYSILGIPKETSDDMLLTVFSLRVQDAPSQEGKMKEALEVLAESRNSERLRAFLRTGTDPGDEGVVIVPEWPRGLNQLGNTCYLNSLLQYFYTIKDLRQVILAVKSEEEEESSKKDKLSDAQIQQHRVGGRLVTRKEIERSRLFLTKLSELFMEMAWTDQNAVTPSLELAKLALVTSKDEEEDEAKTKPLGVVGTGSSASTDATLVEEALSSSLPPLVAPSTSSAPTASASTSAPTPQLTGSVLGKRPRDSEMDVDEPEKGADGGFVLLNKPRSPRNDGSPPPDKTMRVDGPEVIDLEEEPPTKAEAPADSSMDEVEINSNAATAPGSRAHSPIQVDVDAPTASKAPPLPKRQPPPLPPRKQTISDSTMMFGKQHDVSECMDNCMFQIETALLKFGEQSGTDTEKTTSVVKSLFYGTIRQRVTVPPLESTSAGKAAVNEKDDLFSHLPVNVSDEGYDLYDGLSGYFQDNVEFEGKRGTMEVSLVNLPPILQIQLQRVQFNRETLQPYKSQSYLKFGETLYMDRFLEDSNLEKRIKAKEIQGRLTACRERINLLTQEHGVKLYDALNDTLDFLDHLQDVEVPELDTMALETIRTEANRVKEELVALRSEVIQLKQSLEELWKDEQMAEYELTSVFIHRGSSPSWGHYFFYARNLPDKPDEWFKYNDSTVSMARKDEVLADTTGSTANPYLLVYARKGSGVVHTVNRNPS